MSAVNSSGAVLLARARTNRFVLQDFRPLEGSLDWELGQLYLRERGNKAFICDLDPVPYVVNNDGDLSTDAAEVFFAGLVEAERAAELEQDLFVLELGIGTGLFARFFLDHFQRLCGQHGKDFYHRLTYVAADRSPRMVRDAGRSGVFAPHAGRCLLRVADALDPAAAFLDDPIIGKAGRRPFRAVFLNYLLDCLPAAVVRAAGDGLERLCVRTCLARGTELRDFGSASRTELRRLADSHDPRDRLQLLKYYPAFVAEYRFDSVEPAVLPYGRFASEQATSMAGPFLLHNHGALLCLERLLELTPEKGFILVNDYGPTEPDTTVEFQHQRFSQATFVGVNFRLLKSYFGATGASEWVEPDQDDPSVRARLIGRGLSRECAERFRQRFGKAFRALRRAPAEKARECIQQGRVEAALECYREALELHPYSWPLLGEVAQFLAGPLGDPKGGLEMARAAIALNKSCSADLWSAAGECLLALQRFRDADLSFLRALQINADDVRARFGLACLHARSGDDARAMIRIGEALALDVAAQYGPRLLQLQGDVLGQIRGRRQRMILAAANRTSGALNASSPRTDSLSPLRRSQERANRSVDQTESRRLA